MPIPLALAVTGLRWLRPPRPEIKFVNSLKNQDKEASITKGRELLIAYFQEHGYVANKYLDKKHIEEILPRMSVRSEEALYAAVGFGEISAAAVFNRLTEKKNAVKKSVRRQKLKLKS